MADLLTLIYSTIDDDDQAQRLAEKAVTLGHAACVNVIPGMRSIYQWEGEVQSAQEHILLFKTTSSHAETLMTWLEAAHPYDCPAIFSIEASAASDDFLAWVQQSLHNQN